MLNVAAYPFAEGGNTHTDYRPGQLRRCVLVGQSRQAADGCCLMDKRALDFQMEIKSAAAMYPSYSPASTAVSVPSLDFAANSLMRV